MAGVVGIDRRSLAFESTTLIATDGATFDSLTVRLLDSSKNPQFLHDNPKTDSSPSFFLTIPSAELHFGQNFIYLVSSILKANRQS